MNIEYTCIKGKAKGVYKNTTHSVEPNETANDNPILDIDTDQPDFEGYPQEIDYPDYGEDYGAVDSKIDSLGKVFERLFSLYCQDNAFVIPAQNPHLKTWLDRLEPDGRYFPKKQLNIFGGV